MKYEFTIWYLSYALYTGRFSFSGQYVLSCQKFQIKESMDPWVTRMDGEGRKERWGGGGGGWVVITAALK